MPFVPFTKKSASKDPDGDAALDARPASAAPSFTKKFTRKAKQRRAAPIQKSMMASGRSMGGGGR